MAMKKIRLDFSKTEERSGWNTRHIEEGLYKMKVAGVQETEAQDGTAMLVYSLVPTDSRYKSRNFPYYCKLQQNQLWKLRDLLVAAGQTVPKKALAIDPSVVVGKSVAAEVADDSYQGQVRSQVQGTYGLDILDEDGSGGGLDEFSGDDEDEEEYEDEPEEDDVEDEEEDLASLSLAELRKRAKELGIATTGLKKDDLIEAIEEADEEVEDEEDEDDLDDEDLEDEDLDEDELEDDEEEDEEPAPKRRSAPARKPAAKAAPARRVVKRR